MGQVPGSIIYTGEKSSSKIFIEAIDYNKDQFTEKELETIEETFDYKYSDSVTWINLNGLSHVNDIEKLGTHFEIHPLVLEDIVNISQRPKIDEYDDYLFVVLKMLYYDKDEKIISEQVSFVLGKNYVLSFQEAEGDVFDVLRDRIRHAKGRIRSMKSDYLLYTLMDAIIDHYFSVIETLGDKIEDFESDIFLGNTDNTINKDIRDLKKEILRVRRAIFPLREVISRIEKYEDHLFKRKQKPITEIFTTT
ncbi:CorA family divalent cation transporter [Thalassobellus suaedae]|uniref:CorA family divalent cation transporter n=1 Tax=Thalassobellus suaedae TaxID=3074124 RepID=A0ABY9XYB4_9FLAO|nr:CorA family divalent cation transporter [Flavobacteriaceae bacterium HL-DH14]